MHSFLSKITRVGLFSVLLRRPMRIGVCRSKCTKVSKAHEKISKLRHSRYYGQPTFHTHPHLVAEGHLVPSIGCNEFQERRQRLAEMIVSFSKERDPYIKDHIIIIPSATKQFMSDKIPYVFRQNSDFLYLSGCQEPDSCLVITANVSGETQSILFMRDRDTHAETWDGPRTGPDDAKNMFGLDQGLAVQEFIPFLQRYLQNKAVSLWYDVVNPMQLSICKAVQEFLKSSGSSSWDCPKRFIHELRLLKSPSEIELMEKSCKIASAAIEKCMSISRPGCTEHQLFAHVDYECRMGGAEILAYPPVIAGGDRGTIIHYINNNQVVKDGDMILMDAGCEYHGYTSDITRTWPVNGTFTPAQRTVYEAVLCVQLELIEKLNEFPSLDNLFDDMCSLLGKRLQEAGVISNKVYDSDLMKMGFRFCPHHVSHYLGMDVHDTPTITRGTSVKPGTIVTVEPGVYISSSHFKVPKEFHGMGIRIEDDILITENGPVVLTSMCPKSVAAVEKAASSIVNVSSNSCKA